MDERAGLDQLDDRGRPARMIDVSPKEPSGVAALLGSKRTSAESAAPSLQRTHQRLARGLLLPTKQL
jgi:hypothetical protein